MASASAIEDVSSLPGEVIRDQDGRKLGEVKEIYAVGDGGTAMWVTVETSTGIGRKRVVFIPIARLKKEEDEIRTPYSFQHIQDSPEVEAGDELSEEDDHALRTYYAIGLADQEMVDTPRSYASQVPDEEEPARKADAGELEGQVREIEDKPSGELAREADEAAREKGDEDSDKPRKATAEDIVGDGDGDAEGSRESEGSEGSEGKEGKGSDGDEGPAAKAESEESSDRSGDEGEDDRKDAEGEDE